MQLDDGANDGQAKPETTERSIEIDRSIRSCFDLRVGFETFIRFQPNPVDPRPYAPDTFLRGLDTTPSSLACTHGSGSEQAFEYRPLGASEGWPAVVVTIEPDGFLVCEYDREIGTQLFGPLVKYALEHAKDERVVIEAA